jgi:hypothetical protein
MDLAQRRVELLAGRLGVPVDAGEGANNVPGATTVKL